MMYGCQWEDRSGAVDAFCQYGYDGEDFVTFDIENNRFIATTPQSLITKHKWDNNQGLITTYKQYFTQECIDWLKKYVGYGKSTVQRKGIALTTTLQWRISVILLKNDLIYSLFRYST